MKRIATSSYPRISRKIATYIAKPTPGRHKLDRSVALFVILRDKLRLAATAAEAGRVITKGDIEVNGKIVRDVKYPVGLGDIIKLVKLNETYKVGVAKGATIKLDKEENKENVRTLKVVGKYVVKGSKLMIRLYDGSTLEGTKDLRVNDSVILSGKKIKKVLKFQEGAECLVIKGTHASETGVIKEIKVGSATNATAVKLEKGGASFDTPVDNVMVIGA